MIGRRHFSYLHNETVTVEREEGTRGADGFQKTGSTTVLITEGNTQRVGARAQEMPSHFDAGDVIFYASKDLTPIEVGDVVTGAVKGTVKETMLDSNSMLISIDG